MLNARSDALEIGICELGYPLDMLHPIDVLTNLSSRPAIISTHFEIQPKMPTIQPPLTLLAVMSQLASLSFLKSMNATGTCQSWTAGGLAAMIAHKVSIRRDERGVQWDIP
jgi:hypothetical protein